MIEWISDILELFLDVLLLRKKKDKPVSEQKENLPKKQTNSPLLRAYIIIPSIILASSLLFFSFIRPMQNISTTKDTLQTITNLLKLEKEHAGQYPETIDGIIRRNPTQGDLSVDSWDNFIVYHKTENGENFELISKGKDGILANEDDISINASLKE